MVRIVALSLVVVAAAIAVAVIVEWRRSRRLFEASPDWTCEGGLPR